MTTLALVLYLAAFLFQALGVVGLVRDVVASRRNVGEFMRDWDKASEIGWPEPAQDALAKYAEAENNISGARRWVPVGLLIGGLVVGTAANLFALA